MYPLSNEAATEEKDLGVWVQANMKPAKQCASAAKSANFALGQISKAFHFRKKENLVPLYKTFVRPKLEFAGATWNPWTEGEKKAIRKSARKVCADAGRCERKKL